jgi:hypothetical protein
MVESLNKYYLYDSAAKIILYLQITFALLIE